MQYVKKQKLHERQIGDRQLQIMSDGTIELSPKGGKVVITGDLEVTGSSSGVTDPLIYYVSTQGNDENDGLAGGADRAKASIKSAVEAAPPGATIKVAPGDYYENNPITLKERMTVRGDSLRNTQIFPKNSSSTIFYMDCACYLFQLTFRGLQDPGWCAEIRPGALVTVSPYVQNCTNMNGPWLNDGTEFVPFQTVQIEGVPAGARPIENDPAVPLAKRINVNGGGNGMLVDGNQYDQRSLVFSFVADAFTQIAQGGIGFHITNFGYTQIVSCFSVFTRIGFQATKGGYLSISNSVSDFGTFAIIADGVFDKVYTTARPIQDYTSKVGSITVNSTGAGYQQAPIVEIEPPSSPGGTTATATATVDLQRGEVTGITITNQGDGYTSQPTITFIGGGFTVSASATANLLTNKSIIVDSLRDIPQTGSIIKFDGDPIKYYVTGNDITQQPFIYDETICRRDVARIIDAVIGDIVMGTNYQAISAGRSYLRATSQKVLNQQLAPTIYGIEAARDAMLERLPDNESGNIDVRYDIIERFAEITAFIANEDSSAAPDILYNDLTAQDRGHSDAKDVLLLNKDFIVEEVIEYVRDQFTELSYNQEKCERDVRLICTAIGDDIKLGTDYNTITAGLSYLRANSSVVINRQLDITKTAFQELQRKILEIPDVLSSELATLRVNSLFTEFFDILNGSDYNTTTCRRDLAYIFDSVQYDSLLDTNYNSITAGLSYERAPSYYVIGSQFQQTVGAIERAQELAVTAAAANVTAAGRVDDNFQEVLDILTIADSSQDTSTIQRITWSEPGALYQNQTNAREQIQNNRAFIVTELTTWIDAQIAGATPGSIWDGFTYNSSKCERDVGFILDAVSFDVQYNGNFATRRAADAYFSYSAAQLPTNQQEATADSYLQLSTIVQSIILETYPGQDTTAQAGTATEQSAADQAILIIEGVVRANSLAGLPALVEPTTSWVDAGIDSAIDDVLAEESTIVDEVIAEIGVTITNADTISFPNPTLVVQAKINAKDQLQANKRFIQEDVIAYIANEFPTLTYKRDRCFRDVGYIIDALSYDILYGANTGTLTSARAYYANSINQLGTQDEIDATLDAYKHLQGVVVGVLIEAAVSKQTGNPLEQDTTNDPATVIESTASSDLIQIIIDVISAGNLDDLPGDDTPDLSWVSQELIQAGAQVNASGTAFAEDITDYILVNFPDFTYDREKCKRDVGIIIDSVTRDTRLNTNHNSITSGLAYQRATASTYKAQQMPATLMSIREAKRLCLTYVENNAIATTRITNRFDDLLEAVEYGTVPSEGYTYPAPGPAPQVRIDAARLLQANKDFMVEDTVQYINNLYFVYDSAKCRRDSELILKAVTDDLQMGTNYNSVAVGLSYYNANASEVINSQLVETIAAITKLKTESLSYITDDAASTTTAGALFDEVIDIIQNGTANADALTFTNPLANAAATNSRTLMQLNRAFIINELITWIGDNFPNLSYDEAKCRRDTGYLIDAISYDIQYETNQAMRSAATIYFEGTNVSQLPYTQRHETAASYVQLGSILSDIITENYAGQTGNAGQLGTATEQALIVGLAGEVAQAITANSLELLEAQIDLDTSGTSAAAIDSATDIFVTNKVQILDETITYINNALNGFSYSQDKCARDTGFVIEALTHDLLYGGNRSILVSTRSYFDDGENQVANQEGQTAAAFTHLQSIAGNIIEGAAIVPQTGNTLTQEISGSFGTGDESNTSNNLLQIIINAIDSGSLEGTPGNEDPDISWIDAVLELSCAAVDNAAEATKTAIITFINTNIISFSYNEDKCARDTKYIFDAAVYDMMYGGNKQTRRAGEAYYSNSVIVGQEAITEFTYKHLASIMGKIAQNQTFTKTPTNTLDQVIGDNAGTTTAGLSLSTNLLKIAELINFGSTTYLPVEIDHSYDTTGDQDLNLKRIEVLADAQAIEDEAIRALNLEFGGIAELDLFPQITSVQAGTLGNMQNVSTVSTSGHAFEYVGAGVTYNALPFFGGSAISENERVETNDGKIFAGGTVDQIGNFAVGNFFNVNALTGSITLNAEEISLNGIASIGPFKRFGIPVGVELKEVSNSFDLTSSTGSADVNTVPSQVAVKNYVENRYLNKLTGGTVQGDVIFDTDIAINGGDITTTSTTFNLLNDNANNLNFAGGTTNLVIGAENIGTTSIRHNFNVALDVNIDGDAITTTELGDFDLLNENASTINAFGDATTMILGAVSTDSLFQVNSEIVIFNSVGTLQLPVGTTAQRGADSTAAVGQVRFNTDDETFEGYDGANWGTLGGVKDVDQDTFIRPETLPGADEDTLQFFVEDVERMSLNKSLLTINSTVQTQFDRTEESIDWQTGAVTLLGGMGIAGNLHVQGYISGDSNNVLQLTRYATDKVVIPANIIESTDGFKIITDAGDSTVNDLVTPITIAHHNQSGVAQAGQGVGFAYELETTNNNFIPVARVDVVSTDVTFGQEDVDMIFQTRIEGSLVEKLRISENLSTFTTSLQIDKDLFVTGILDAAGFRGSFFADDSTEILDGINNKITVVDGDIGTLILTTDLEVQYGGTGVSTFTEDGILYGDNADPVKVTDAAGTSDASDSFQILTVTSDSDATPIWTDTIDGGAF